MTTEGLFRDSEFRESAFEYRWLLEHGYSERSSLKLVGDKHRLTRVQRNILFRGVVPHSRAAPRLSRLIRHTEPGHRLLVDAHNVTLTILNYRLGHPVFLATDGLVRDAGGGRRRVNKLRAFQSVLTDLAVYVRELRPVFSRFYFDAPFSGSATHAKSMTGEARRIGAPIQCRLTDHADSAIVAAAEEAESPWLCTSDSQVIDRTACCVYDLAGDFLRNRHDAEPADARSLFT